MRSENSRAAAEIGKSIGVSTVATLAAVLVFALFIKLFSIGSAVIMPINQIIKMLAILLGCILCLKPGKNLIKGLLSGAGVVLLTYLLFAAIAGEISFGWGNVLDFVFGCITGAIGGVLCAILKNGK